MVKLSKSWTTVTPFSKALALSMLVVFPVLGFLLGIKYQQSMYGTIDCSYLAYCQPDAAFMYPGRMGAHFYKFLFLLIPLVVAELFLKGYALWIAGKNKQTGWFIALFVINSLGILPLIYLFAFKPKSKK